MKTNRTQASVLLTMMILGALYSSAVAQIDLDEAKEHGMTTAVTTTMHVQSKNASMIVTGKHNLLRETLLSFIRDQGLDGLKVSFPKVQWPDGRESDPKHSGYTGEFINGYHRFIQNNIGEAITAEQNLETAVNKMFKDASITVPNK